MLDDVFVSITLDHAELNLIFDKATLMKVMTLENRATEGKLADKKRRHNIIRLAWILILHGLVFNLMLMALILMLAPFFSDMEPSFFVLKLFFRAGTVKSSWVLRIIRSALNGFITSHCIVCGSNGTLYLLAIINLSQESLRMIRTLSCKCACNYRSKNTRPIGMLMRKLMFSYRQLVIIMDAFNPIMRWSLAIALASGMGIFVLGGSGSVILAGKVNFSTYVLFPLMAFTLIVVLLLISPPAEEIHIMSSEFIFSFKENRLEPRPFRYSRAMKPLRIQMGSFYYFKKASALTILVCWVEHCLNVLLSS
jgi:hypothetical protein